MATAPPDRPKDQAAAILVFAREVGNQLPKTDPFDAVLSTEILCTLDKTLDHIPLLAVATPISIRRQMNSEGTRLWNTCAQLMPFIKNDKELVLVCKVKALGYAMLEHAASRQGPGSHRVLEVALNTAKVCTENREFDLSQKIIETIAVRLDDLERSNASIDQIKLRSTTVEYYMLRIYLSWFRGRSDIADHLYSKILSTDIEANPKSVVEVCYKVGKLALSSHRYDTASRWLERALNGCGTPSDDMQQHDTGLRDKKLLILHAFVRANLHLKPLDSEELHHRALESLRTEHGDSFAVQMIQLEMLRTEDDPKGQEYFHALQTALKNMELNDSNLKLVMCYVQKLKDLNLELYLQALKQLLVDKLAASDKTEWIERIFVNLIWASTDSSYNAQDSLNIVQNTTIILSEHLQGPLSEDLTLATLILIWKCIDKALHDENFLIAEQWCRLVLELKIFQTSLDNRERFLRKLILCALDNSDTSSLYGFFDKMNTKGQQNPSTLSLMYKVALSNKDFSLGQTYLESFLRLSDDGGLETISCIAEALRVGQISQAARVFQHISTNSGAAFFKEKRTQDLFRFMLHLLSTKLEKDENGDDELLCRVVGLFGIKAGKEEESKAFPIDFLQFVSKESYIIALKLHKLPYHSESVIRLLDISKKLTDLYLQVLLPEEKPSVHEHYLLCDYLGAIKAITEARKARVALQKNKYYNNACEYIEHFRVYIPTQLESLNKTPQAKEWIPKYLTMLSFDFEASLFLQKQEYIPRIIEESRTITDDKLPSIFLDCILRSGAPVAYIAKIVKLIIRTLHSSTSPNLNKKTFQETLPQYLRILFHLSLDASDDPLAESVLDQALILARDPQARYPSEEIQWFATVAFNRAVDLYALSADGDCRRWAEKAITLADCVGTDSGALGRLLRRNLAKLS